jgi:glycine hydroxymethyltransferase
LKKPWLALKDIDSEIYQCIEDELERQNHGLELIASENFAEPHLIAAMANIFTNKYAEGRPGKRYYGGCENTDRLENLAITRACDLFKCNFANVQPHSGAQANAAVLLALAEPGSSILGLDLSHGGHLTHGSKVNFSGIYYKSHAYKLDPVSEVIDYKEVLEQAKKIKPKVLIAGASSYSQIIDFKKMREIADEVGAYLLVDMAHIAGLVATDLHPSPIPHAHVVTSTTHKTLRGPRGGLILWNDEKLSVQINKGVFPGTQGGPLEHIIAAKAVCFRDAATKEFRDYQNQVIKNTKTLAQSLKDYDFKLVSNGSQNHLLLIDLSASKLSGKYFEQILEKVAITVNKNTVPNETKSPFVTSGIRIGTPALSSRRMKEPQMQQIAEFIKEAFIHHDDNEFLNNLRKKVISFAKEFPLYENWTCDK